MTSHESYLLQEDASLLADCTVETYRSSGPGGQHRNKTSSAVRLRHQPTGVTVTSADSRSQHENKRRALKRLRRQIALDLRRPTWPIEIIPAVVVSCLHGENPRKRRLEVGRKDRRFWAVAGYLLDYLAGAGGRLSEVAATLGITTGNLVSILKSERHLLGAAQEIRRECGQSPIR